MKDFERRIAELEGEIKALKEKGSAGNEKKVPWYKQEKHRADVITEKQFVVPVLKAIMSHRAELKGKKVPQPLWSMARGVVNQGWVLSENQVNFAFDLINTKHVDQVKEILVA